MFTEKQSVAILKESEAGLNSEIFVRTDQLIGIKYVFFRIASVTDVTAE